VKLEKKRHNIDFFVKCNIIALIGCSSIDNMKYWKKRLSVYLNYLINIPGIKV
jgi:hypothetical protein